jgi:nucleotide-binding universal stress UspA family protein
MEQAGPQPSPEKPDRASQRRPSRDQQARLPREAPPDKPAPATPEGQPPGTPLDPGSGTLSRPCGQNPAPQPSPASNQGRAADIRDITHPVVVGYDGSGSSRNALAYAVGFARRLGRPLLIVYVLPFGVYCEPMTGQVVYPVRDRAELEPWLLRELDETCDWHGLDVSVLTRRGNAARELAAAAESISADALVVGAPGHWVHHLAGSIPSWLARHARCPVIVVP